MRYAICVRVAVHELGTVDRYDSDVDICCLKVRDDVLANAWSSGSKSLDISHADNF